jgi:hypothetical protein
MQHLNLIKNGAFGGWIGGVPNNYSTQLTNTTLRRLQQGDPPDDPERAVFLDPHYAFGRDALRATLVAAAAVDAFRIWPFSGSSGIEWDAAFVGPFRAVTGTNDIFRVTEAAASGDATIAAGFYNAATFPAALKTAIEAATGSTNTYAWTYNALTRLWTCTRSGGTDTFAILGAHANTTAEALIGFTTDTALDAAAKTGDSAAPPDVGAVRVTAGQRFALGGMLRGTLGYLLRQRVVLLNDDFSVNSYLVRGAEGPPFVDRLVWQAADGFLTWRALDFWRPFRASFEVPAEGRYLIWQLSNGTAGAGVIDLADLRLEELTWRQAVSDGRA